MSCLGNLVWLLFGGLWASLIWCLFGVLWCLTIVGIPVGLQCFKLAKLQLAPFGKEVVTVNNGSGTFVLNILWLLFGGLEMALVNLVSALMLDISIVGIQFDFKSIKIAKLSLMPFGKEVI